LIEATVGLLLTQLPPEEGSILELSPIHIDVGPVNTVPGLVATVIGKVASDIHPELVCVNVNVALPRPSPVTVPSFVTEATVGLLLVHTPPVEGLSDVVLPMHIKLAPVMVTGTLA
jgi:hypothetical protein